MKYVLMAWFGRFKVPVDVEVQGKHLILSFPYHKELVAEVKGMEKDSDSWDPITKKWRVLNNKRNLFALSILTKKGGVETYLKPYECKSIEGLWQHQCEMFSFSAARKRCILAAEMRTGKTLPIMRLIEQSDWPYALWVSPLKPILGLQRERFKWGITKEIRFMTYEHFRNNIEECIEKNGVPGFVVFDECHRLKTPSAEMSQVARKVTDLMEDTHEGTEFVLGLSGTPAPKDPTDWWNICEIVRPGFIRESSKNALGRRLGVWEQREGAVGNMYWHLVKWKENEVHNMYARLSPLVQVHLKKDCLDLPPIRYEIAELQPSKEMLRVAKMITKTEIGALVVSQKLRQLSDGFMYIKGYNEEKNREERETKFVGTPKIDRLKDDLDLHEDVGRLVVFTGYQGSVDIITKTCLEKGWVVLQVDGRGWQVFKPEGEDREITVDMCLTEIDRSSDTHTIEKLVISGQSDTQEGLEYSASPTIIYYSNSNKGASRMQSEARAHSNNMDKQRGLTVIDYCLLPSDKKIRDSLMLKKDLQSLSMGELISCYQDIETEDKS
jgi:hypothetical protein